MLKLNDNGDLVRCTPTKQATNFGHSHDVERIATAAELKAAGLVQGEVGISREDARLMLNWYAIFRAYDYKDMDDIELAMRLRAALKENEHD